MFPWADKIGGAAQPGCKAVTQGYWALGAVLGSFFGAQLAGMLGRRLSYFLISLGSTALTGGLFLMTAPLRPASLPMVFAQGFVATDPRKILERKDVDAVVIATPDHWHALLAIWACQGGKDVYVEKPVSHNVWEGGKIMEAAAKYGRIVQAGTQYRSDEGLKEAAAYIHQGNLGKVLWGHVLWYELRGSIGKVAPYTPEGLDYDLYCGPASVEPLTRASLHYDWHWAWSTGTGDLGNSGIHAFVRRCCDP